MARLGFLASFLAAFITMDAHFFNGAATRQIWDDANYVGHAIERQFVRWTHPIH